MAEQLALLEPDRVYRNDREAWELHEAYYSDQRYVWPLVKYLRRVAPACLDGPVVEPCAGGRALVDGLLTYHHPRQDLLCGDVRDCEALDWVGDWTSNEQTWRLVRDARADVYQSALVFTNPPFTLAMEIVEASWRRCPGAAVAILQRSTWYEPTREHPRGEWLRKHNPDQVVIGRCKFTLPDGTSCGPGDSCSYTWYVWGPDRQGLLGGHHEIIPWWEAP
jgi:hypothetical protein